MMFQPLKETHFALTTTIIHPLHVHDLTPIQSIRMNGLHLSRASISWQTQDLHAAEWKQKGVTERLTVDVKAMTKAEK